MEYSEKQYSIEAGIAKGRPLPEWYLDEPDAYPGDHFYLKAFYDLNSCRSIGLNLGPIPWDKILKYAEYSQLDTQVTECFLTVIATMDNHYLEKVAKEQQKYKG